jgi:hypothetical protein
MRKMTTFDRRWTVGAVGVSLMMMAPPALAYLDPSTGTMVISAVVGLFATAALAVKTYWYKLRSYFRQADPDDLAAANNSSPASSTGRSAETEPTADR